MNVHDCRSFYCKAFFIYGSKTVDLCKLFSFDCKVSKFKVKISRGRNESFDTLGIAAFYLRYDSFLYAHCSYEMLYDIKANCDANEITNK